MLLGVILAVAVPLMSRYCSDISGIDDDAVISVVRVTCPSGSSLSLKEYSISDTPVSFFRGVSVSTDVFTRAVKLELTPEIPEAVESQAGIRTGGGSVQPMYSFNKNILLVTGD